MSLSPCWSHWLTRITPAYDRDLFNPESDKVVNRRMVHAKVLPRKKWPAFATIEAAKEFYESRIQAKLRAGYQLTPRRRKK